MYRSWRISHQTQMMRALMVENILAAGAGIKRQQIKNTQFLVPAMALTFMTLVLLKLPPSLAL